MSRSERYVEIHVPHARSQFYERFRKGGLNAESQFAVEEYYAATLIQRGAAELESFVLLEEWRFATARDAALRLSLRADAEIAQASQVSISPGLDEEGVNLVVRDADVVEHHHFVQGSSAGKLQRFQIVQTRKPDGQIDILALVPDLLPAAPKIPEARDLFLERRGDGTE